MSTEYNWPEDVKLFQPYQLEQIMLHENASCLAVIAYLKACNLPHTVEERANAEFLASNGRLSRLPLLCVGKTILSEFEAITRFATKAKKPINEAEFEEGDQQQQREEENDEREDQWTYITYVEDTFTMAELYFSFMDERIYKEVTVSRMYGGFPWPLNHWRAFKKRRECLRLLRSYEWLEYSVEDVIQRLQECCVALTEKLMENKTYFFGGEQPDALDAIVFGHIFAILTTKLPNEQLAQTVSNFTRLCVHCRQLEAEIFTKKIECVNSETRFLQN